MAAERYVSSDYFTSAATVLGLFSLAACWLFPFGAILGIVGAALGVAAWLTGHQGQRSLVAIGFCAYGATAGLLLGWDYWLRVL
jgi:hypothetical protein